MFSSLNNGFTRLSDHPDLGRLVLRVSLGALLLFHGVFKLQHGVGWIAGLLQAHNVPGLVAYGAYIGEVLAPALVIIGLVRESDGRGKWFDIGGCTLLTKKIVRSQCVS